MPLMHHEIAQTALMIVDVQGSLAKQVDNADENIESTLVLAKIAQQLTLKTWYVEHCAQQLGHTDGRLLKHLGHASKLSKTHFSLWQQPSIRETLEQSGYRHFLVCGMECHVCVYQSVSDMLKEGIEVTVVADATASRTPRNYQLGLHAMRDEGANIASVEMLAFALMKTPKHAAFRDVLSLIK